MKMDWHIVIKILTGVLIVPMSIMASSLWPWWTKASLPVQILSAVLVLPFVGITALAVRWWADF